MAQYIDGKGDSFDVHLTIGIMREVREHTGFVFATCTQENMLPFFEMLDNWETLSSVLRVLIGKQLENKGLNVAQFEERFSGDAIESAREAVWDALAFFCPTQTRQVLMTMKSHVMKTTEAEQRAAIERLETFCAKQEESEQSSELSQALTASET